MVSNNDVALITSYERLSFAQTKELAESIAAIPPSRSVVFLVATNCIESIAGYIGFLRKHVVVLMIRPEVTEDQFATLLEAYGPQFIWAPKDFQALNGTHALELELENRNYQLWNTHAQLYPVYDDLALLLTTSGSTGTPKYVRLTYENLKENANSIAQYQSITPSDRAITTLPFSYSYGISIVNSHLIRGASLVLTEESILSRNFWNLLKSAEATNFGGVPYTYSMLRKLHFDNMELPSLRFISQAGGRLGEQLQEEFASICKKKALDFFVMYGQTEATARMSWLPPDKALSKLGSIGIAIPNGHFELHDTDDSIIQEANINGELVYKGPNVSLGYATNKADLSFGDERHGVLHTGDIARFDEDGFFYVTGRMKRFLKMFGNRVNMDEIEATFAKQGIELACVGTDDHMVIFVVHEDPKQILQAICASTSINRKGFDVKTIEEIPHTPSGKVDYVKLGTLC